MKPALLLNSTYEPIEIISWRKGIKLIYTQKASPIERYDKEVSSAMDTWKLPSVVRLKHRVKVPKQDINFTRLNVYRRDGFKCQYCGDTFDYDDLTFDHVFPKSRGGATDWDNIVTSCKPCNFEKGDRTPDEADMDLLSEPSKPGYMPFNLSKYEKHYYSDDWDMYLWC